MFTTCIIFGAQSKVGQDVSKPILKMLKSISLDFPNASNVSLHLQDVVMNMDLHEGLERGQTSASTTALGTVCLTSSDKDCMSVGESNLSSVSLIGKIFNLPRAPSSIIESFEKSVNSTDNLEDSSRFFLESLDGQYAFVLRKGGMLLLARDPIGVKPLYVAENDRLVVFSSRRRPIWGLGMRDCGILSQPILVSDGKAKRVNVGIRLESQGAEQAALVRSLIVHLSEVIRKMAACSGNKIAILFSGGLDSSVIAKLSEDMGIRSTLYCAGTLSSRDITNARRMSSALDLPLVEKEIAFDDVTNYLLSTVRTIESDEMIPVSTSLPFFFALQQCGSRGEKIVLHGQGADELFCGYERYESTLSTNGYRALCTEMLNDVLRLGAAIPLYDDIGAVNGTQLLAPFADVSIVKFSLGVPIQLKLIMNASKFSRKHILRELAYEIGVPRQLLPEQKVALQFGSGVAGIMDKISRKAGFSKNIAKKMGFPLPVQAYLREIGRSLGFP